MPKMAYKSKSSSKHQPAAETIDDEEEPYRMMGSVSTLPQRVHRKARPIGFIWPKAAKRGPMAPRRSPRRKRGRG